MRLLLLLWLSLTACAADTAGRRPLSFCASNAPGTAACNVAAGKDLKQARAAFERGMKLQRSGRMDEALAEFSKASSLLPQDVEFATAREMTRQQIVYEHVETGSAALSAGKQVEGIAELRAALSMDPQNDFARQRLSDALGRSMRRTPSAPQVLASAGEILLAPQPGKADFHFRGDSRELLAQVARAFGVTAVFDDSVISRRVRFDIQQVDFYTAMQAACDVTKSFWTPLDEKQLLLAAENQQNHRQFDRMAARTFYLPFVTAPQELNDVVNALRTVFGVTFITPRADAGTITVRAPQRVLDAATEFLDSLDSSRPQVLLDIKVYEISRTFARDMGLQIPNQFRMFNIPASALAALGGQNIQDLINQLIASGGINQANSTAISALLAQLQNQQNSIFSQPLATFGNGLTLFGVSPGTAGARLSLNESSVHSLEHATLRAAQGKDTNFRLGSRFPILNASFAPIFNTAAIARVIQNNTFQAAFPSFNYEDLGLTIKAKPQIHGNSEITLGLEMQVRSLTGTSLNGVPVISSREYKSTIVLRNAEPAVVAGAISRTEQRSLNGIPGLGNLPGLNQISASNSKQEDEDEILIVITPHVISEAGGNPGSEIWMSTAR